MGDLFKLFKFVRMFFEKDWSEKGTLKRGLITGAIGAALGLFLGFWTSFTGAQAAGGNPLIPTIAVSGVLGIVFFLAGLLASPADKQDDR